MAAVITIGLMKELSFGFEILLSNNNLRLLRVIDLGL